MRLIIAVLIISAVLVAGSCYAEITGIVVDAETGQPVEGAIVFVEWTKTKGLPGLTSTRVYKIVEVETDKEGKFSISGTLSPFVDPPMVVIYKRGYVAWRNDFIFPGWKKRTDFKYQSDMVIKLEKFREEFSHKEHLDFIEYGVHLEETKTQKLDKAVRWEKHLPKKAPDSVK